jgi:hypothetical protein
LSAADPVFERAGARHSPDGSAAGIKRCADKRFKEAR